MKPYLIFRRKSFQISGRNISAKRLCCNIALERIMAITLWWFFLEENCWSPCLEFQVDRDIQNAESIAIQEEKKQFYERKAQCEANFEEREAELSQAQKSLCLQEQQYKQKQAMVRKLSQRMSSPHYWLIENIFLGHHEPSEFFWLTPKD